MKNAALIIANGTMPKKRIVAALVAKHEYIVCADGGANHARRLRIIPSIIIGDFDSITDATKRFFKEVPILYIPEQYSTDLEKAITHCIGEKRMNITIIGATGDRIDHVTGALGWFKKFGRQAELKIVDDAGEVTRINKRVTFSAKKGDKISLIPLERCTGITTHGLLYSLRNESLELGVREGISNRAVAARVSISLKAGTLLLYRYRV